MKKFIIKDWAGNVMDTFKMTVAYKVAMDIPPTEFASFDDAEDFLCEVLNDDYETDRGEYYVVDKE
jgi:hypothetical protein